MLEVRLGFRHGLLSSSCVRWSFAKGRPRLKATPRFRHLMILSLMLPTMLFSLSTPAVAENSPRATAPEYCARLLLPLPVVPAMMPAPNRQYIQAAIAGFKRALTQENGVHRLRDALHEIWFRKLGGVHSLFPLDGTNVAFAIFRPAEKVEYVRFTAEIDPRNFFSGLENYPKEVFKFTITRSEAAPLDFPHVVGVTKGVDVQDLPGILTSIFQGPIVSAPPFTAAHALVLPTDELAYLKHDMVHLQEQVHQLLKAYEGVFFEIQDEIQSQYGVHWDEHYKLVISNFHNPGRRVVWEFSPGESMSRLGGYYHRYEVKKKYFTQYEKREIPQAEVPRALEEEYHIRNAGEVAFWLGNDLARTLPQIVGPDQDFSPQIQQLFKVYQQNLPAPGKFSLKWADLADENHLRR